jgi:hypothetical protein
MWKPMLVWKPVLPIILLTLACIPVFANEVNDQETHHDFGVAQVTVGNTTFVSTYRWDNADLWHACLYPDTLCPVDKTLLEAWTYATVVLTPLGAKPNILTRDYGCVEAIGSVDANNAILFQLGDILLRYKSAQWSNRATIASLGPSDRLPHWSAPARYHVLFKTAEDSFVLYMTDKGCQ